MKVYNKIHDFKACTMNTVGISTVADDVTPSESKPLAAPTPSGEPASSQEATSSDDSGKVRNTNTKCTIFISNLDFYKKEPDILDFVSRAGSVKDIRLVKAAGGRSKGFGYVEYNDEVHVYSS